jgi:ribonuclease G
MAKEICISSTPHETRLAILEDDQLAEIYYERENEYTLAGSVYKGRVTRVLPGMQSAFVDIGLERDAFLYVTDFLEMEDQEDTDEVERAAAHGDTIRLELGSGSSPAPAPVAVQLPRSGPAANGEAAEGRGQGRDGGRDRNREPRGRRPDSRGDARGDVRVDPVGEAKSQGVDLETGRLIPAAQAGPQEFGEAQIFAEPASVAEATAKLDESDDQNARRWR